MFKKKDSNKLYQLGYNHEKGIEIGKNEKKAFKYYKRAAELGNAIAMYDVGRCYHQGLGVEKDEKKAFKYSKKAAELGIDAAICNIGVCYFEGIGVEKDEKKAFEYYKQAADMSYDDGIFRVGFCYYYGIGVETNYQEAFKYYMKSANMGHIGGICNIGECYYNGEGIEKDYNKAFEYYKKSADMGDIIGINRVANCYRNGIGVQRNILSANYWFRKHRNLLKTNLKTKESLDINSDIKEVLDDDKYKLSWIDYNEFKDIKEIGKIGFATVYCALWFDRINHREGHFALKEIHGSSDDAKLFINELKNYCEIGYDNPSFLQCIGVSKNIDYIAVLTYAKKGPLSRNLDQVSKMSWKDKLNILYCIASDLESIHSEELVHGDLQTDSILQSELDSAYVTYLGLSERTKAGKIYGVMPYIAPEVLLGQSYTTSSDIYSLGIIMTEISTGRRALLDTDLQTKIINGTRPECTHAPELYVRLANRCMDNDPCERPTATTIVNKVGHWLDEMNQNDNEIKKQFLESDKVKPEPVEPKHPIYYYSSKLINTDKIDSRCKIYQSNNSGDNNS